MYSLKEEGGSVFQKSILSLFKHFFPGMVLIWIKINISKYHYKNNNPPVFNGLVKSINLLWVRRIPEYTLLTMVRCIIFNYLASFRLVLFIVLLKLLVCYPCYLLKFFFIWHFVLQFSRHNP